MKKIWNVVFAGIGGQGMLFVARVISEAALKQKMPVVMNEIHGLAQRGGTIIPITIAQKIGHEKIANVVMLGTLIATGILPLSKRAVLSVLKERLGFWAWKANKKAFSNGYDLYHHCKAQVA